MTCDPRLHVPRLRAASQPTADVQAAASLALSHWERLGVAPAWRPASEAEREEHGEAAAGAGLQHNLARRLANAARARKGLPLIGGKVVGDGTKQRTRARKV
jgi:hypothetical protein